MLVVTGKPGRLKGAMLIAAIDVWYASVPRLTEVFLYIDPGHRRSANARELRNFAAACRGRDSSHLSDGAQICAAKQGAGERLTNLSLEPALAHERVA